MKNVSNIDKIVRYVIAFILAAIAYKFQPELGIWYWALFIASIIVIATAMFNFCPIYRIFGISTCKLK
ncbi:MAG: DUF2892 domain-containing protein [Rhizobiales bacterium]|nr:DUF2892 domain-containing protein [Hyphomicrobiales bacterium]